MTERLRILLQNSQIEQIRGESAPVILGVNVAAALLVLVAVGL